MSDQNWNIWADNWLSGTDRSANAASDSASYAAYAANAANAASYAANAANAASYAARCAAKSAFEIRGGGEAGGAACDKILFEFAETISQILISMNVPGIRFLSLLE